MNFNASSDSASSRGYTLYTADGSPAPLAVSEAVEQSMQAAEQFYGGIRAITAAVNLKILYDPLNRSQAMPRGAEGFGGYSWLERVVLLGEQGLRTSLIHELAHLLDVEAGPTRREAWRAFLLPVWTHRINLEWQQRSQPGGQFLMDAVTNLNAALQFQTPADDLLHKLQNPLERFTSTFLAELWGNLVEETACVEQSSAGLQPVAVNPPQHYDQHPMYWPLEWIDAHRNQVHHLIELRKTIITERMTKHQLEALHQARRRSVRDDYIFSS
jgi:hypothetical protein